MNKKFGILLQSIIPFLVLGFAIAIMIGLLTMFFYIILWGFLIGGALWLIAAVKHLIFPPKNDKPSQGRIIEHHRDDN